MIRTRTKPHVLVIASLLAVMLVVGGCVPSLPDDRTPVAADYDAEYVVRGTDGATALAASEDGHVFYGEKNTGVIRVLVDGALQAAAFADLPVNYAHDRGILSIALAPDFEDNRRVYVLYSRSDTGGDTNVAEGILDNRIVYFNVAADGGPDIVAAGGEVFVASLPAGPLGVNPGGRIAFGTDGLLYVALGDFGQPELVQDDAHLHGKLLRYNPDGTIPDDNRVSGSPLYARGLRDPRGLVFDPLSESAFLIDRQADGRSEINVVSYNGNYGWPGVTGMNDTPEEQSFVDGVSAGDPGQGDPTYIDPTLVTSNNLTRDLTGMSFNVGGRYGPDTLGDMFVGDSGNRRVVNLTLDATRGHVVSEEEFAHRFPSAITDVLVTPAGTMYVATETDLFRIVPAQ